MPDNKNPQQPGRRGGAIEQEDARKVGNDNDFDQDSDFDVEIEIEIDESDVITQRNPRVGDRDEQGQRQMERGKDGTDRDQSS